MAEWRFLGGWSKAELEHNFTEPVEELPADPGTGAPGPPPPPTGRFHSSGLRHAWPPQGRTQVPHDPSTPGVPKVLPRTNPRAFPFSAGVTAPTWAATFFAFWTLLVVTSYLCVPLHTPAAVGGWPALLPRGSRRQRRSINRFRQPSLRGRV